jgi:hypothetical protein
LSPSLHLFVEVVLALALLHLRLDAAANALLDLLQIHFAIDQPDQQFKPLTDVCRLEHFLLVCHAHGKVCRDGVSDARRIVDTGQAGEHLRGQLAALLDQLFEQRNQRARYHVKLAFLGVVDRFDHARTRGEHAALFLEIFNRYPRLTFDQHLDGAIRQFEQLQHACQRADLVQVGNLRIVDIRAFLRDQQDLPLTLHGALQRTHGFVATDKQWNDHMRINHYVTQRQYRQSIQRSRKGGVLGHLKRGPSGVRIKVVPTLRRVHHYVKWRLPGAHSRCDTTAESRTAPVQSPEPSS